MTQKPRRRWTADAVMFGTTLLMGSSYPFAKDVLAVMSPLLYSASRYLVASLFLFAMMVLMRKPMALPQRDWVPMILLSLIGVSLFQACWGLAMARSAPSVGSIVMTTTTAFSAILAWLGGRRLPVLGWTTLIGSLVLLPISLVFDSLAEFARLDDRLLGFWLYTAIFPVGVAFLGLTAGLDRLGVSRVMVYMYLIPVAGVGLSAAFFGDPLTAARVLGGLIVLLGVILTRVALDRAARVPV